MYDEAGGCSASLLSIKDGGTHYRSQATQQEKKKKGDAEGRRKGLTKKRDRTEEEYYQSREESVRLSNGCASLEEEIEERR